MTVRVEAAVFFRVIDPVKAVIAIRDYQHGVLRIAQTTLRATLGQHELDDLLGNQAAINELLKQIIDAATEPWGINVVEVETKDVDLPDTMKRAMARQAEAEREREHNSTLVLPIPFDMLDEIRDRTKADLGERDANYIRRMMLWCNEV